MGVRSREVAGRMIIYREGGWQVEEVSLKKMMGRLNNIEYKNIELVQGKREDLK